MLAWLVSFTVWQRYNGELVWSKQSTEGQRAGRKQHAALSESKSWAWLTPKAREQAFEVCFANHKQTHGDRYDYRSSSIGATWAIIS